MGQEIEPVSINEAQRAEFAARLRAETLKLKRLFDTRAFAYRETPTVGLEVEACLVDAAGAPLAENEAFLDAADDPLLVHELARFNFEANVEPCDLENTCFSELERRIENVWRRARQAAATLDATPLMIGILPTLTSAHLNLGAMSRSNRYRALNEQLFVLRREKPLGIDIRGRQHLRMTLSDVMLEAAATSIQVHLSVNQEDARRVYNAAQLLAAPLVALAANAPFLYGRDLWDETRIPVFEQAVRAAAFRDKRGSEVGRVTMGTGYSRHGFLELFLQNLDAYPPMLPILLDDSNDPLAHLKLHNGTVWRWNRPIIGSDSDGTPHLRLEQRVMASGPSIADVVANTMFSIGATLALSNEARAPEESMTFTDCKANFYAAARDGLDARLCWSGRDATVGALLIDKLLPAAADALAAAGIAAGDIDRFIHGILGERVRSGRNGSTWQRAFVAAHGADFQRLTRAYIDNQATGAPVHEWMI